MPSSRFDPVETDRLARFLHALRRTPIPTAPSPHDAYQEALGLNLLALGLRLEHVNRMSESLTLADSTHMARTVTIDITMNTLTADQRWALRTDPGAASPTRSGCRSPATPAWHTRPSWCGTPPVTSCRGRPRWRRRGR